MSSSSSRTKRMNKEIKSEGVCEKNQNLKGNKKKKKTRGKQQKQTKQKQNKFLGKERKKERKKEKRGTKKSLITCCCFIFVLSFIK